MKRGRGELPREMTAMAGSRRTDRGCPGRWTVGVAAGLWLTAVMTWGQPASTGVITWHGGAVFTAAQDVAEMELTVAAIIDAGERHAVVQFERPPEPRDRDALRGAGIRLLRYLGDNAYFAALDAANIAHEQWPAVGHVVRCVLPIRREWKLHADFLGGRIPPWAVVDAGKGHDPATGARGRPTADDHLADEGFVDGREGRGLTPADSTLPRPLLAAASRPWRPGREGSLPEPLREREGILPQPSPEKGRLVVAAYVLFHPDVPLDTEARRAVWRHGARIRSVLHAVNGMVVELPLAEIGSLADEDAVQWIEPPLPALGPANNDVRTRTGADLVQQTPYGLDGAGVRVMVYDTGYGFSAHPDFGGRHRTRDNSGLSDHATHVAGTIGGDGTASSGTYRGMAPAVQIESYGFQQVGGLQQGFLYTDPGDLERDYDDAINNLLVDLANNSLSSNVASNGFPCHWEGNYGVTDVLIDTIVRGDGSNLLFTRPFRIVWAAGNERQVSTCLGVEGFPAPYHSVPPPACAKNHITVGAVNSNDDSITTFSSFGPADDGRLKPDLVAPGCQTTDDLGVTSCSQSGGGYRVRCGTSMSCPAVTGLAALLLQDYRAQFPGRPDFRNATLKAVLAHTAVDLGSPGPDYRSGYGSVRIKPAVDLMRAGDFLEAQVDQGETYAAVVVVQPGEPTLKVTLAWDDVPGTPNVNPALVNDLDLRVYDSENNLYYPWTLDPYAPAAPAVRTGPDRVNNIEQVVIDLPVAGPYRVEVVGYNVPVGPQPFSLCASPRLNKCSSAGTLALDRPKYMCQTVATLRVVDCDLNTDPQTSETAVVVIASTTEPAGEPVTLTETGPDSAVFVGTVLLDTANVAGVLAVTPGDTLTATYSDADNGRGGVNVEVTATAVVDCDPPVISNVQASPVQPRSATITLTTDEPARVTVRWGTACESLQGLQLDTSFRTAHSLLLANLAENTAYYFVIDAEDEAGNRITDDNSGQCYRFDTPPITRYFTELLEGDLDLANKTVEFVPAAGADAYDACVYPISTLPTDPSGGSPLALGDDNFVAVTLTAGKTVALYGVSYSTLYVGSNGYITFTAGDTAYDPTLANHFRLPRVAGLFTDLNPTVGGTVSRKVLEDRVAVTYTSVVAVGGDRNTFQIELFFDGRITLSYLSLNALNVVVGLSRGAGLPPDYYETDLSALPACGAYPPTAYDSAVEIDHNESVVITLQATDDGLPDPPAALTYVIVTLPEHGVLTDPLGGEIQANQLPYALLGGRNEVRYTPRPYYGGTDRFTFQADDGGTPPEGGLSNGATISLTVGRRELLYRFDFDTDPGWSAEGLWAFGVPTGGGSYNRDPAGGHTGVNVYGYNLAGDYTNNMPRYYLTTTPLDCTGVSRTELRFYRWLGVESSSFDRAGIEASGDGVLYKTIWEHSGGSASESSWTAQKYDLSSVADGGSAVRVRWGMGPTDGTNTYPGWNLDDVEIWGVVSQFRRGDLNCDFRVDFGDINPFVLVLTDPQAYEAEYPDCPFDNRDVNGDGLFDFGDINPFVRLLTNP